jgi:hypothetical protein
MLIAIGGSLFESTPALAADLGADLIATDAAAFISQLNQKLGPAALFPGTRKVASLRSSSTPTAR